MTISLWGSLLGDIPEEFTGPRVESYRVELLSSRDEPLGFLPNVLSGKVTWNHDAATRSGFNMELLNRATDTLPFSWMNSRFRPWVIVNSTSWPLGVYLPASPTMNYDGGRRTYSVPCLDKTSLLDTEISQTYSVTPGSNVIELVRTLILSVGETNISLTPSSKTVRIQTVWPVGTAISKIIRDLLDSIDYGPLYVDGYGQFQADPHIVPETATPIARFIEGETAIHSDAFSVSMDIAGVPNKVILISAGTSDVPALVSIATNTLDSSPYSYGNRGNRWVTRTYSNVEAADQATLDSLAQRYLWTASTPPAYLTLSHAVVPLSLLDAVEFVSADLSAKYIVNEMSVDLKAGSLMTGKWQEVSA